MAPSSPLHTQALNSTHSTYSSVDFGRKRSERPVGKSYLDFLEQWTRRLKRSVKGPADNQHAVGSLNGVDVGRKGRGSGPLATCESAVDEFRASPKRLIAGASYACKSNLLDLERPFTADELQSLTLREGQARTMRKHSGRHNISTLQGSGAIVGEEAKQPLRAKRGKGAGAATLDSRLVTVSLAWDEPVPSELEEQLTPRGTTVRTLWTVESARPATADSILRHRMSSPGSAVEPAKFEAPVQPLVSAEQRRGAFYASLNDYALNKIRGEYGTVRCRAQPKA